MSVRTSSKDYLQVVFLIDENSTSIYDGISLKDASNSVCLCVLRILSYFNALRDPNSSSLRWGFKFYNSRSLNQRYQRHNFKEFCVSEFENFEKDVSERFDEELRSQTQEQNNEKVSDSDDEFASNTRTSTKPTASKSLTCALTDLVHDFQWEINDLNSPLRTTRRSNLLNVQQNSRRTQNIVFLFTKCPTSFDSLRQFSVDKIQDLNSLRNAVMSYALFREFNEVYKINLNWINTDYNENNSVDKDVVDVVGAFLQMFNGSLIPIQSLVHIQKHPNSTTSLQCGSLIPVMSVLSQHMYMRKIKKIGVTDQSSVLKLPNSDAEEVQDRNLWVGWLCSPGDKPVVHCTLQLSSMLSPQCCKKTETNALSYAASSSKDPTLVIRQNANCENTNPSCTITTLSDNPSTKNEIKNVKENFPTLFWIKGAARREKICPSWFHLTKVYSCVALVTEQGSSGLSGWFQKLMITLAKQNLSLIIELRDPECGIPVTSVLQPLTSICGVLNIVNSCKLLTLEKLLVNQRNASVGRSDEQYSVEDFDVSLNTDGGKVRAPMKNEIHCLLMAQSADAASSLPFTAQDLNSWSLGLACLDQGPHTMQKTSSEKCSDEEISHESSLIKKLKEFYSKKRVKQSKFEGKKEKLKQKERASKQEKILSEARDECPQKQSVSGDLNVTEVDVTLSSDSSSKILHEDGTHNTGAKSDEEKKEIKILLESLQLNVEKDLQDFLKDAYLQTLTNFQTEGLTKFIDKCLAVIDWYLRKKAKTQIQELTVQSVLTDHLLLSNLAIRDNYEGLNMSDCKQSKLTEYQLQVLLRLEIACTGDDNSSLIEEVVVMLRSISFIQDPGFLRDFLKEAVLTRYAQRIPKFLCEIYEGLMQDLPNELLSPSKLNSEEESPLKRSQIPSVLRPESDQPRSDTSRPLTRHRSIADMGGKRREIVVLAKAKTETSKRKHDRTCPSSSKEKREHHQTKPQKTPVKKVRRNLFTEEEESSDMTSNSTGMSKNRLKVPSVFAKEEKVRRRRHKEIRRHSVAVECPSNLVKETPGRKQIHNALWQKQHRARKRTSTVTDLNIVHESPLKDILAAEGLLRRSPRRHPGSIFQRSQSFYGQNPKSCPLVRTRSSSSIRSGSPIKKLDLDENTDPSNLEMANIETATTPVNTALDKVKESPLRFSPRRRKRFALHTLLAETKARTGTEQRLSSSTKAMTPKAKGEAPVRSSPRLLKKRSFSCIGFSNPSSCGHSKWNGKGFDCDRKASTPGKKKISTPARSSTRFKKSASDSCGMVRIREALSGEGDRISPKLRIKLIQSPSRCTRISDIESLECSLSNLGQRTVMEPATGFADSSSFVKSSNVSQNDDSDDSEVILNLKQPELGDRSEINEEWGSDGARSRHKTSSARCVVPSSQENYISVREFQDTLHSIQTGDIPNNASVDLVDSSEKDNLPDGSKEKSSRISRSNQRGTFERSCEESQCNSNRTGNGERDVLSRKRLSFSPSKKTETKQGACVPMLGFSNFKIDINAKNNFKPQKNVSAASKEGDGDSRQGENLIMEGFDNLPRETSVRAEDGEDSAENCLKAVTPPRRSPRKHLTKDNPVCGSQRLLTPKPARSTPPAKKRRKTRSQTEQESKRSSPLNQILKQRKKNRPEGLKSPHIKAHSELGADTVAQQGPASRNGPRDAILEGQADCFARLAVELSDECSRSSEDLVYDWLAHIDIDKQENLTDIPKNNAEQKTKDLDARFEEDDDVFQNPSSCLRSKKKPYNPVTPISAKSIQILRESPLLVNASSISVPQGSISKKWSDSSPVTKCGRERLKRRKRSEAFGGHSSELDTSTSDDGENAAERNQERNWARPRKRKKLNANCS